MRLTVEVQTLKLEEPPVMRYHDLYQVGTFQSQDHWSLEQLSLIPNFKTDSLSGFDQDSSLQSVFQVRNRLSPQWLCDWIGDGMILTSLLDSLAISVEVGWWSCHECCLLTSPLAVGLEVVARSLALLWMLHSSPHLLSSSNPPTLPPEIVVVALPSNVLSSVVEIVAVQPNHSSTIFREWAHQPSLIWSSSCSSLTSLLIWSSDSSSPTSSSSLDVVASFLHAL